MPWWLRAYLIFAAVQGLGIGLTGLGIPSEMQIPLRISPLNARFVAALYLAGGVGVLWAALSKRREETRLFVCAFGLATGMILILTVLHWSEFMAEPLPHRPIWIFDYVADPLLALIIVVTARLWPPRQATRHRLTPLLVVEAVVLGALGLTLIVAPDAAAANWPWTLPPLLGQLYGCFFVTFGVGAALAARENEPRAVRGFALSSLTLFALVLLASLLHLDRFTPQPVTVVWFSAFGLATVVFLLALITEAPMGWLNRLNKPDQPRVAAK